MTGAGEILLPAALARMPGARVIDRLNGTAHVVGHVDHPAGGEYVIHWADGSVTWAGARHPFLQEQP